MATSLLALLDDVATVLDDVAALAKVAAKKTSGVLGDDLALNANQVAGVRAERELPVVWAVAKGSVLNKAILVPSALAVSAAAPWAVTPLLVAGGVYLCYEGFEKLAHRFLHSAEEERAKHAALVKAVADPAVDLVAFEKEKIAGAIRTDFILSAEIIVITLGAAAGASFVVRAGTLCAVAAAMTVFVYGFVAAIVRLDDAGRALAVRGGATARIGEYLLLLSPMMMRSLSVLGTAAMFMVGGGILLHALPVPHLHPAAQPFADAAAGVAAGALALALVSGAKKAARR
ncbi:MAG: DUF808 domain-containing protein [Elusimicrobiota bacterium]|nr:MAG: DUF808 domain-containing protein [Elusimicrobiota bacterium]